MSKLLNVPVTECPIDSVTVYRDRAEVTRRINLTLAEAGEVEVVVQGLSSKADRSSVRVTGGAGAATILEVACRSRFGLDKSACTRQAQLRKEIDAAQQNVERLNERLQHCTKQKEWVEGWADGLKESRDEKKEPAAAVARSPITKEYLESVAAFVGFYGEQLRRADEERAALQLRLSEAHEHLQKLHQELNQVGGDVHKEHVDCSVSLSVAAPGPIAMQLAYVVSDASWHASYDCRATSGGAGALQLSYYGVICNNCGEDWIDAKVALSTAQPAIGGEPPELPTAKAQFKIVVPPQPPMPRMRMMKAAPMMAVQIPDSGMAEYCDIPPPPMAVLTAIASQGLSSATFTVPRSATIASDCKEHKVTVAVIDLSARFSYSVVAKLSPNAFLKASATNTSGYQILAGPMNIFIDGNFVSTSQLKDVGLQEEFSLFLGVDGAVRVEYKPAARVKDQTGLIQKRNVEHYRVSTTAKNTKQSEIALIVYEQLPLSNDEKIKVTLIEPDLKKLPAGVDVKINSENNLEWRLQVAAGASASVDLHYSVEWPQGTNIDVTI